MKRRQVFVIAPLVVGLAVVAFIVTKSALPQAFCPDLFLFVVAIGGVVAITAGFKNVLEQWDRLCGGKEPEPVTINPPAPVAKHETTLSPSQFPQPNLFHTYHLEANITGRVLERADLTAWLADNADLICALVAMGGIGKSALAWYWVTHDILKLTIDIWKLHGVMWWSFYEGEASFAKFVDEALQYLSGHNIDAARLPNTYDRAQELCRELQSKRVLFVLDGFERQLRAYARLDAAYQRDATADESRDARACVEPNSARFKTLRQAQRTRKCSLPHG